jgi:hypothetical protein
LLLLQDDLRSRRYLVKWPKYAGHSNSSEAAATGKGAGSNGRVAAAAKGAREAKVITLLAAWELGWNNSWLEGTAIFAFTIFLLLAIGLGCEAAAAKEPSRK